MRGPVREIALRTFWTLEMSCCGGMERVHNEIKGNGDISLILGWMGFVSSVLQKGRRNIL